MATAPPDIKPPSWTIIQGPIAERDGIGMNLFSFVDVSTEPSQ
jgi:hypothetical protein